MHNFITNGNYPTRILLSQSPIMPGARKPLYRYRFHFMIHVMRDYRISFSSLAYEGLSKLIHIAKCESRFVKVKL